MLRSLKCNGTVDKYLEIAYIPSNNEFKMYPSIVLLTNSSRYTRRVYNL